jgi:hypothetical protein
MLYGARKLQAGDQCSQIRTVHPNPWIARYGNLHIDIFPDSFSHYSFIAIAFNAAAVASFTEVETSIGFFEQATG